MPSRWSAPRPRPAWAGWDRPSRSRPLVKRLGDPVQDRLAGGGLGPAAAGQPGDRRRGDRGGSARAPTRASAAERRGSSPTSSTGMDDRLDLAERFIELTGDPDLWTRLQALRTLRQWFYRTGDAAIPRRIIETYLARMAEPDVPVVRKNLSEGLYIMLDENLGGGVSLQKNIAELPEAMRPGILEARRAVRARRAARPRFWPRSSAGMTSSAQAVLEAFDGSFFKGRSLCPPARGHDRRGQRPGVRLPLRASAWTCSERTFAALLEATRRRSRRGQATGDPALQLLQAAGADLQPGDPDRLHRRTG